MKAGVTKHSIAQKLNQALTRFWACVSASDVRHNSETLSSQARSAESSTDSVSSNSPLASSIGFLMAQAAIEDVDYRAPRRLDKVLFQQLATCRWIAEHRGLLLTRPCASASRGYPVQLTCNP